MNRIEKKTKYNILNQEIQNLGEEPKVFYYDLGKALLRMKKSDLFKKGDYRKFKQYVKEESGFSWNKAGDLMRIYTFFSEAFDQCRPSNKASERVILSKTGWGKTIELKNRKDKYSEALERGILDIKEVLYYGSLTTKEKLIDTFEKYQGIELWVRIYSKIYFPEILEDSGSLKQLCARATKKIIKKLSRELESSALQFDALDPRIIDKTDYSPVNISQDKETLIDTFLNFHQLERKLSTCLNVIFTNLAYQSLADELEDHESKYELKHNIASCIDRGIEQSFYYGPSVVAKELNTELDNVLKWLNNAGLDLLARWDGGTPVAPKEKNYTAKLRKGDIQPTDLKRATRLSEEEMSFFNLAEVISGFYITGFIESGFSEEEAFDKVAKLIPVITDWNLITPLIEIAGDLETESLSQCVL